MGSLQPLGLYAANSIFLGDYLTTEGQEKNQDIKMLEDLGFEIELMPKQEEVLSFKVIEGTVLTFANVRTIPLSLPQNWMVPDTCPVFKSNFY